MNTMTIDSRSQGFWHLLAVMPIAAIVTLVLTLLMYKLIATDFVEPDQPAPPIDISSFDPPKDPKPPEVKKLIKPKPVEQPARLMVELDTVTFNTSSFDEELVTWSAPGNEVLQVQENSGPIPNVRVEPAYPRIALQRGQEGYVDLMFDITASGSTENIRVVGGEPGRVFDKAAVKAISRWKYRPQMIEGQAVPSLGQATRLTFTLEQ